MHACLCAVIANQTLAYGYVHVFWCVAAVLLLEGLGLLGAINTDVQLESICHPTEYVYKKQLQH